MKVGDLVSIIDEDFRGKIIALKGNSAIIEDEHGFEHEVEIKKLVPQNHSIYDGIKIEKKQETFSKNSQKNKISERVLDLHFEKLVKNPHDFEPWERLMIQKENLIENLEFCRQNFIKKLTVIHGIGDGILQEMVYDVLRGFAGIEFEEHDFFYHSSGNVEVIFL